MRECRVLYFVKSKNFIVLLCFYVNTFIILSFLRWVEGGPQPPSHPLNPLQHQGSLRVVITSTIPHTSSCHGGVTFSAVYAWLHG